MFSVESGVGLNPGNSSKLQCKWFQSLSVGHHPVISSLYTLHHFLFLLNRKQEVNVLHNFYTVITRS